MLGDAASLARMYPSLAPSQATTESTARVSNDVATQTDSAPAGAVTNTRPAGDVVFKPTHPHDAAARLYPNQEPPAGSDAAKARAEAQTAEPPVEVVPDNIKALRESDPAGRAYPAHYDEALGFSTKALLSEQTPAETIVFRNMVSGMAHDSGIDPSDMTTIVNRVRAVRSGSTSEVAAIDGNDMADAQAMYDRDPRIAAVLNHFNAAGDPAVLRIMAKAARAQRARGRL
jgi:hypothetical protein